MRPRSSRLLLFSISVLLVAVTAILLLTPPVASHESSIYPGYSPIFWLSITLIPVLVMIYLLLSNTVEKRTLLIVLVVLYTSYLVLFALPAIRGYFLYGRGGADVLAQLGDVKTIIRTGYIGEEDFYPLVHVLVFMFSSLGISMNFTPMFIAITFYVLYSMGMFVFVRRIAGSTRVAVLTLVGSMPLVFMEFHLTLHPFLLSFLMVPFVLYLSEESRLSPNSRRYVALLALVLLAIVFAHPETTVLLLIIFATSIAARALYNSRYDVRIPRYNVLMLPMLTITFFTWYFSFQGLREYNKRIFAAVLFSIENATPEPRGNTIAESAYEQNDVFLIVIRFVEKFGSTVIFCGLAAIMAAIVLWRITRNRHVTFFECYAALNFVVATITAAVLLFGIPAFGIAFMRAARYPILFAIPLVALLVFGMVERRRIGLAAKHRKILAVCCVILVLATVPLTINGLFVDNYHLTNTEHRGTEFLLEQYDEEHATKSVRMTSKVEAYLYGSHTEQRGELPFRRFHSRGPRMPRNIGYGNYSTAGEAFASGTYLITKEHDLEFYRTRPRDEWNETMVYSEEDLETLSNDRCVDRIYSNGGFDVWLVC